MRAKVFIRCAGALALSPDTPWEHDYERGGIVFYVDERDIDWRYGEMIDPEDCKPGKLIYAVPRQIGENAITLLPPSAIDKPKDTPETPLSTTYKATEVEDTHWAVFRVDSYGPDSSPLVTRKFPYLPPMSEHTAKALAKRLNRGKA